MIKDIIELDGKLLSGWIFCRIVNQYFVNLKKQSGGYSLIRKRANRSIKKLIEEIIPIANYIRVNSKIGQELKVRWVNGCQNYDAIIYDNTTRGYGNTVGKYYLETTQALPENDYMVRMELDQTGHSYGHKNIWYDKSEKQFKSKLTVTSCEETIDEITSITIKAINKKLIKNYNPNTILFVNVSYKSSEILSASNRIQSEISRQIDNTKFKYIQVYDDLFGISFYV